MVKRFIQRLSRKVRGAGSSPSPSASPASSAKPAHKKKPSAARKGWSLSDFRVPPKNDAVRFHDFNLPDPLMHAIHDLGFHYCTPIQEKVFAHASEHQNIAGRAQTGTGKTAAFLIHIFARFLTGKQEPPRIGAPRALILAPTRELVIQIVKDATDLSKYCPFHAVAVFGGMDFEKQRRELTSKPVDLIAATPGRLIDFMRRRVLDLKQVEVLVIDEADRMLDMGFIPDVRRIIRGTPPKHKRQTMLFSATLTDTVLRLASEWMPDPVICEVDPEKVTVDTVTQVVYMVTSREKFRLLYNLMKREAMQRVLIFGNRRDSTRRLADNLRRHGVRCAYLSGAVEQDRRLKVLNDFRSGKVNVVVATDVAGRGLHVDDITHVINYEFPYEPEDYVHRIGRTGRAGTEGTAISFACETESFVIPEIEEYIGDSLPCVMPDADLLDQLPPPLPEDKRPGRPPGGAQPARTNSRGRGSSNRGSGSRGAGSRSRGPTKRR